MPRDSYEFCERSLLSGFVARRCSESEKEELL